MRHFTVRQFAKACQAQYFGPEEVLEQEIHGVVIDNRQIEEGYLFAAVAGERVDGHTFIPSAFEKGAICALSEQKLENPSGPYLLVENTLQALKDAAEAYRKTLTLPVVAITGSVGKTSTKEMISSILSQKYSVLKTPGNLNNEILKKTAEKQIADKKLEETYKEMKKADAADRISNRHQSRSGCT